MVPKFRGGSDDWLDDEDSRGAKAAKERKVSHARAEELPPERANATVVEVYPNQCRVRLDADGARLLCPYRRMGVQKKSRVRERTFVAVGDRVVVSATGSQDGVVEGVCRRLNKLSRPAPGREEGALEHVIAANLDRVVIVASCREPRFSPGLVDRFLVAVQAAGISPVICLTKVDLREPGSPDEWDLYRKLGFAVFEVSAKTESGISELKALLTGKRVLFCGHSGVGKTSLLRALLGEEIGRIGDVSLATGKGKHTTTSTVLLGGPEGSSWMDSPGLREFGLLEVKESDLHRYFPEFQDLGCFHAGCTHTGEERCNARELPRYASYLRMFRSLEAGEN